jgi:hypothetical protein
MTLVTKIVAGQIALRGALALSRLVLPDGRFVYRYRQNSEPKPSRNYNVLRHCGAAWAMLDVARHQAPLPKILEAGSRVVRHLIDNFLLPFGHSGAMCVVDETKIKLGGGGLALLALADLFAATGDRKLLLAAESIGTYILSEQKGDGEFVHTRNLEGDESAFRSDYYTGEALFGLMSLYSISGESKWFKCVTDNVGKLFDRGYGVSTQSHWMLYALDRLYAVQPLEIYLEHARQIAENIVLFPEYRGTNRSTPIACRSEGLLAYVRMLNRSKNPNSFPSAIECLRIIRQNLLLQRRFLTADGAFVRGAGKDEIRIDYIQHNISSFSAYSRLTI